MVQQSNEHAPYPTYTPVGESARSCPNNNPDYRVRVVGKWGWCRECENFIKNKCIIGKLLTN